MTTVATNVSRDRGFLAALSRAGDAVLTRIVAIAEANPRVKEMERLSAMTDDELAKRGLDRSRLFEHVFRGANMV